MQLVSVNREKERELLLSETRAIRARLDEEEAQARLDALADAGDQLLREREAALLGVTDWSGL